MTLLPPTGSTFDTLLDGYTGESIVRDTTIAPPASDVVYNSQVRSKMWTDFLVSIGKPITYDPSTDPVLTTPATTANYAFLVETEIWGAFVQKLRDDYTAIEHGVYEKQLILEQRQFEVQRILEHIANLGPSHPDLPLAELDLTAAQQLVTLAENDLAQAQADAQVSLPIAADKIEEASYRKATLSPALQAEFLTFAADYQINGLQRKFHTFLQRDLLTRQTEQRLLLSLDEIRKRHIVFTIFDILLVMLQTIQENVGVLQQAIQFIAKHQREYTNQMASIGFYLGESSDFGTIDTQDLSKWTLGYADISIEDYLLAAISPRLEDFGQDQTPETQDPGEGDGIWDTQIELIPLELIADPKGEVPVRLDVGPPFDTTIQKNVDMSNSLTFVGDSTGLTIVLGTRVPQITNPGGDFDNMDTQIVFEIGFDPSESIERKLEIAKEGFLEFINQTSFSIDVGFQAAPIEYSLVNPDTNQPATISEYFFENPDMFFHINWEKHLNRPYDEDHKGSKAELKGGQARSAKNQLLQQYLENARTRRETLANQQDTLETTLDSTKDSLSRAAEIISTSIKQLQNIITSIFRVV